MSDEFKKIIMPEYKMIISYDIRIENSEEYYQFVMGDFVPKLQKLGVYMTEVWHTAYGDYPIRMVTFVTEDYETLDMLLNSEEWYRLETQLLKFVTNYNRQIVPYRTGFQVVRS